MIYNYFMYANSSLSLNQFKICVKYLKIIDDGHKIVIGNNLKVLKVVGLTNQLAFAMFEVLNNDIFFQSF